MSTWASTASSFEPYSHKMICCSEMSAWRWDGAGERLRLITHHGHPPTPQPREDDGHEIRGSSSIAALARWTPVRGDGRPSELEVFQHGGKRRKSKEERGSAHPFSPTTGADRHAPTRKRAKEECLDTPRSSADAAGRRGRRGSPGVEPEREEEDDRASSTRPSIQHGDEHKGQRRWCRAHAASTFRCASSASRKRARRAGEANGASVGPVCFWGGWTPATRSRVVMSTTGNGEETGRGQVHIRVVTSTATQRRWCGLADTLTTGVWCGSAMVRECYVGRRRRRMGEMKIVAAGGDRGSQRYATRCKPVDRKHQFHAVTRTVIEGGRDGGQVNTSGVREREEGGRDTASSSVPAECASSGCIGGEDGGRGRGEKALPVEGSVAHRKSSCDDTYSGGEVGSQMEDAAERRQDEANSEQHVGGARSRRAMRGVAKTAPCAESEAAKRKGYTIHDQKTDHDDWTSHSIIDSGDDSPWLGGCVTMRWGAIQDKSEHQQEFGMQRNAPGGFQAQVFVARSLY
ncbi:hypothetical protein C8R46DRAFT_1047656 [Mycena filopes]|nr:hypothetical protein C8R46DRAFT_1047656 [Mycena filopes]